MTDAYKQAGVDIAAGNEAVERMKKHVKSTFRPEALTEIGGFGGLFGLDKSKYEEPVLVSGTDGVGTKLKLAFAADKHDTVGIDAVAMCVNDIVVQGAEPLFFLDYLAVDRVVPEKIEAIVSGIAEGCRQSGCALIGGETAEMPGMYSEGEYDIAGFSVGAVDRKNIIDGSAIKAGDVVLGLASSGVHSNGFSLVRKLLLEDCGYQLQAEYSSILSAAGVSVDSKRENEAGGIGVDSKRGNEAGGIGVDSERNNGAASAASAGHANSIVAADSAASDGDGALTLGDALLTPTRIYVKPLLALMERVRVNGIAHITGGGFTENIPRVLPDGVGVEIDFGSWPILPIFDLLRSAGKLSYHDLFRTFNMGIGMVVIVSAEDAEQAIAELNGQGEAVYRIGRVVPGERQVQYQGVTL